MSLGTVYNGGRTKAMPSAYQESGTTAQRVAYRRALREEAGWAGLEEGMALSSEQVALAKKK